MSMSDCSEESPGLWSAVALMISARMLVTDDEVDRFIGTLSLTLNQFARASHQ